MINKNSFTLIELLVVIAILAVLATAVIIALNPFEFAKQARDARRLSELQVINTALGVYQTGGGIYLGSSNTVYVSVPSATSTCSDLGLPSLPSGWAYHCVSSSTLTKVDGTGWISVDFTSGSYGPGLEKLPIDPINTTSSRNYYTYTPGGSWELAASFESDKYKLGGGGDKTSKDGGQYPDLYEVGNNLTLLPVDYGDSALVGYWKFDETSGTLYDSSGRGNNGTQSGGVTYGVAGKVGTALGFDGSNDYIRTTDIKTLGNFSYLALVKLTSLPPEDGCSIFDKQIGGAQWPSVYLTVGSIGSVSFAFYKSVSTRQFVTTTDTLSTGAWYHLVGTYDGSKLRIYINGVLSKEADASGAPNNINNILTIGATEMYNGSYYFTKFFNGIIDDARIYSRALSPAEITAIYNAAK